MDIINLSCCVMKTLLFNDVLDINWMDIFIIDKD